MTKESKKHKKDKKDKKAKKDKKSRKEWNKPTGIFDDPKADSVQDNKNIFGEDRDSQESVKSFALTSSKAISKITGQKSNLSSRSIAASDYEKEIRERENQVERKIFKKDANLYFRKMAAIIDLPDNRPDPNGGTAAPTLKDQIYSGEILKRMYHRKDI